MKQQGLIASDSGVYDDRSLTDELAERAEKQGLAVHRVDLAAVDGKPSLMWLLKEKLSLPLHFGGNWDALADVLGDDHWMTDKGKIIAFENAAALRRGSPDVYATLEDVLRVTAEYWKSKGRPFFVFFAG